MIDRPLRVRFAPSPTGSLHLGNARTALFNWLAARRTGGCFVVRVEDTDTERERKGSEAGILEDLRWLGMAWDEGPGVGGDHGPYRQSERAAVYDDAVAALLQSGRAYRCFCTDRDLEAGRAAMRAAGTVPRYEGRCSRLDPGESERRAAAGQPFAIRFRSLDPGVDPVAQVVRFHDVLRGELTFGAAELGDAVLIRRDGRATYNFAAVVDDAAMEIDLIMRGDDHLSNTPRQVQYYEALDRPVPRFAHLPMVRGADGERLSKRHGAVSVAEYRRLGYPVEGLLNALVLLGWAPRSEDYVLTVDDMIRQFDPAQMSKAPSTFDADKLAWLSGQHIQRQAPEKLAAAVGSRLEDAGLIPAGGAASAGEWLAGVAEMLRTHLERFSQVPEKAAALFSQGGWPEDEAARGVLEEKDAVRVVEEMANAVDMAPPGDVEAWRDLKSDIRDRVGLKGRALFRPIRVAVTGTASGPDLDRVVPLVVQGHRIFPDHVPSLAGRARRTLDAMR